MSCRTTIRLMVENISNLPVDFLRLAFEDSTIAPAQQALAEGEMSVYDTYEMEYELLHRPLFAWDNDDEKSISPGGKTILSVSCLGKVGWYVPGACLLLPA